MYTLTCTYKLTPAYFHCWTFMSYKVWSHQPIIFQLTVKLSPSPLVQQLLFGCVHHDEGSHVYWRSAEEPPLVPRITYSITYTFINYSHARTRTHTLPAISRAPSLDSVPPDSSPTKPTFSFFWSAWAPGNTPPFRDFCTMTEWDTDPPSRRQPSREHRGRPAGEERRGRDGGETEERNTRRERNTDLRSAASLLIDSPHKQEGKWRHMRYWSDTTETITKNTRWSMEESSSLSS